MSQTYVYIAAQDEFTGPVKVGVSSNPERRVRSLNTTWTERKALRVVYWVQCQNRESAFALEQSTLRTLEKTGITVRGELAWCKPSLAVGTLQLVWQIANTQLVREIQYELFAA